MGSRARQTVRVLSASGLPRPSVVLSVVAIVVAVIATGSASAAPGASKALAYRWSASLSAAQELPKPKGVPKNATGYFTATLRVNGNFRTLAWQLSFAHLSGQALAAHVHIGKRGVPGPVVIPLCAPCKSGQHGALSGRVWTVTGVLEAITTGRAYVNVHTAKNGAGEIRGQISARRA
jgi:CHRD domain